MKLTPGRKLLVKLTVGKFYGDPIFAIRSNGDGFQRELEGACSQEALKVTISTAFYDQRFKGFFGLKFDAN